MKRNQEEIERPNEWLRQLQEEPQRYRLLLDDAGSLALAAHRIACARCRTGATSMAVPTGTEVHAAAREIQELVPTVGPVPRPGELVDDCMDAGFPVLPTSRAA